MSRNQNRLFWACLIVVLVSGVVIFARSRVVGSSAGPNALVKTSVSEPTIPVTRVTTQAEKIETELITITPRGFEPKQITRPVGRFIFAVENRSGLRGVKLRLNLTQMLPGTKTFVPITPALFEVTVPREQQDWNDLETLAPGRYLLSEPSHPSWRCDITITPQ